MARLLVARHGARADADPAWAPSASHPAWNPPLSEAGRQDAAELAARALQAGVSAVVASPFARCLETAAVVVETFRKEGREVSTVVDLSVCELLTKRSVGVGLAPDPATWAWPGGSVAAAVTAAGLPSSTPVRGTWPRYPEDAAVAAARFASALVAVAADAVAHAASSSSPPGSGATLVVSHGDAVARAIGLADPSALVTAVAPGAVAVFDVAGEDGWEWACVRGECVGVDVVWR